MNDCYHQVYFNETANVEPFQNRIFAGLKALQQTKGINFASVNLARMFGEINTSPKNFGYTNTVSIFLEHWRGRLRFNLYRPVSLRKIQPILGVMIQTTLSSIFVSFSANSAPWVY